MQKFLAGGGDFPVIPATTMRWVERGDKFRSHAIGRSHQTCSSPLGRTAAQQFAYDNNLLWPIRRIITED
jgi:hypothetical protein